MAVKFTFFFALIAAVLFLLFDRFAASQPCPSPDGPSPAFYREQVAKAVTRLERLKAARPASEQPAGAYIYEFFPPVITCPTAERIGRIGDGGKWLCEPRLLPASCVVYSFGGSTDLSFESEINGVYGCETHTFDPSPGLAARMSPHLRHGMLYHAVGLGPTTVDPDAPEPFELTISGEKVLARSLAAISAGLRAERVDVLKLDIEGGEWASIPQFVKDGTLARLRVQQLLVEFHWPRFSQMAEMVDTLTESGFLPFERESNPFDPRCNEYAFVHKDYLTRQ